MADRPVIRPINKDPADEQSLAQIREILFGEQIRHTGDQIGRIENRVEEKDRALRTLLDQRIDELRRLGEALESRLAAQGDAQRIALDGVESAIRAALGQLDERLTLLDSDLQDTGQRLNQSIEEQAAAHERLQQSSVDRARLAELLEGLAQQLRTGPGA